MAQRISRAKTTIRGAGGRFEMPPDAERRRSPGVVLHVLYLMFNEGYTASSGDDLLRPDLAAEAIRLTRDVHRRLPDETARSPGLLALMLLTDARRPARTDADGNLVPLAEQDRSTLGPRRDRRGRRAVTRNAAPRSDRSVPAAGGDRRRPRRGASRRRHRLARRSSPYTAARARRPQPHGHAQPRRRRRHGRRPRRRPRAARQLDADERMAKHHRLDAVRAHLLDMAGQTVAARAAYRLAAQRTTSLPERRYLEGRAARLS